jgi:16S rRNA (uracil1498-N3)-methyltransferase
MALKSVYLPAPVIHDDIIEIIGEEHRHLAVARAEPEEKIEVFDGNGIVWTCSVVSVGKRATMVQVESVRTVPLPGMQLILGQALIRNAAFELALEKAVEVGVTRIIPFFATRSNVASSRSDRWRRVVIEAAKQSKRFHLPLVDDSVTFDRLLTVPAASKIVLSERAGRSLKLCLREAPILYVVGPEGGWTDSELDLMNRAGFCEVSLGPGILRSETAAIVGGALILHEWAAMKAPAS